MAIYPRGEVQNYAGGRLEFHFMVHALSGGLVI